MIDFIKIFNVLKPTIVLVVFIGCSTNSKNFLLEVQAATKNINKCQKSLNTSGELDMPNNPIQPIDLSPIKHLLAHTRVVGLGEFVHASSKLHSLIAGLSLSLIKDYNSRQILLEAPKYAVEQVNELIQPGKSQKITIDKLEPLYRIWRTEGFANFLEIIKQLNQELETPVQLIGFDVRIPKHAFTTFANFLKNKGEDTEVIQLFSYSLEDIRELENGIYFANQDKGNSNIKKFIKFKKQIEKLILKYENDKLNLIDQVAIIDIKNWLELYSIMLEEGNQKAFSKRDQVLYSSANTIIKTNNYGPTILIAHFAHLLYDNSALSKRPDFLKDSVVVGSFLKRNYNEKYLHLGVGSSKTPAKLYNGEPFNYVATEDGFEKFKERGFIIPGLNLPVMQKVTIGKVKTNIDENSSYLELDFIAEDMADAYYIVD